jgi:transposase
MHVVYPRCCGLDVHKETISACILIADESGQKAKHRRTFRTMTRDLLELAEWLRSQRVTHVAMESTGVYWKPVWNILEDSFHLLLINAQHIKAVPGRKTDVKDAEWIADLLQHGLLQGSFVPPQSIRDLRDLTRYRAILTQETAEIANRIQKVLEDANIKLAAVATDVLGVSGRRMLEAIVAGEGDSERLAQMAIRQLRAKMEQLRLALQGKIRDHHRFLLGMLLDQLRFVEGKIADIDAALERLMQPYQTAVQRWMEIPGIQKVTAWNLVAEIGVNPQQFPSPAHLASWAGLCPGNNESAGKRKSGKTRKGSPWLRRALSQAAWAASHTKATYLSARYKRLALKRGAKRAIVAIAHKLLLIAYHLLKFDLHYKDLGANFYDRLQTDSLRQSLVRRLESLGHQVTLSPVP